MVRSLLALAFVSTIAGPFELPPPTGRFHVGTTRWLVVDESRVESFAPGRLREIEVVAWYPTTASAGTVAPYLREGLPGVRSFGTLLRSVNAFDDLAGVRTHAFVDAPVAGGGRLPLLVFSHGYTAPPDAYTALVEDLASHGFVVLSVVHAYEATGATLGEGRFASLLGPDDKLRPSIASVLGEWGAEDATMAAVTRAGDRGEQRRLLRSYLDSLPQTTAALERWVDDIRAVVDRWPRTGDNAIVRSLRGRVDLNRFGVFGHSMGGVASAAFCLDDKRCAAVLNLDGIPQYGAMLDRKLNQPLLMVYSGRPGRLGASDPIYAESASRYVRADVADTLHLDFSDMVFWPALRERHATGAIDPVRAVSVTRTLVREFFDQELAGRRSPILGGERPLAGVTIRR